MKKFFYLLTFAVMVTAISTRAFAQTNAILVLQKATSDGSIYRTEVYPSYRLHYTDGDSSLVKIQLGWNNTYPVQGLKLDEFYIQKGNEKPENVVSQKKRKDITLGNFVLFYAKRNDHSVFKAKMVYNDNGSPFIVEGLFTINYDKMDIEPYLPTKENSIAKSK